ncbi:hypothetical protein P171DRAFT_482961 [Karstenula rhodostoma CBS 690.94]|uniref:GmrSD restriction endonucleases N-terminal domain-containing protein n=1 Tax=Karstenula rhodostoma CBS 690.94 TaxID=1392251 RepID=A0A9P4PKR8_9PLEO|nr:hypothetical protein P171DRAFT_482961 [Karstenula rhodostoma CBS 690.94]
MPGEMKVAKHEDEEDGHALSYTSRPPLAKPGTYLRDIKYLVDAMNDNKLDINPEYQREVVWTADRMSQLIDSLMENYYIPPIIFNRQTNKETGEPILVCVDGKQRLSSVQAFVRGIIPCQDVRGEKWWFKNAHVQGKNKKILSAAAQEEFLNKDFVTFEYTDLQPEQEEDLFARVQMGMPLSAAEKMRATSGPWQDLARHFINDFPAIYSLQKDRMRAKDFQLTLSCFSQILEVQHPTLSDGTPMYKSNYNHLMKLLEKGNFLDDNLKSHLASVWQTLNDIIELDPDTFTNADKRLKGVQTFAPVEMTAVTVLISVHIETRNNGLLLQDIRSLRDNLRENFSDLRNNGYIWKAVWSFVDNLDKNLPASDDDTAEQDALSSSRAPPSRSAPTPVKASAKKGRPTAKTKPPTVLPGAGGSTAVKPEPAVPELYPVESRPRKRPRAGSINGTIEPAPPSLDRPMLATSTQDMPSQSTPITEARTLSSFTSLGAIAAPVPLKALRRSKINKSSTDSLPTPGSTPPFTPAEAHQNLRLELDSYRAPSQVPPSKPARASTKQERKQKQKSIPQYDGVIDLTDDGDLTDDELDTIE